MLRFYCLSLNLFIYKIHSYFMHSWTIFHFYTPFIVITCKKRSVILFLLDYKIFHLKDLIYFFLHIFHLDFYYHFLSSIFSESSLHYLLSLSLNSQFLLVLHPSLSSFSFFLLVLLLIFLLHFLILLSYSFFSFVLSHRFYSSFRLVHYTV